MNELAHLDDYVFGPVKEMATSAVCPNGFVTLTFPCGTVKTFRIYAKRANAKEHKGKRLAAILIGPAGTDEFDDFAFVTDAGIEPFPGTRGRLRDYCDILWAILVEPAGELARSLQGSGYLMSLEKRCLVCNRNLSPENWRKGINKHCEEKWSSR
jgi:hypothetical protein